MADFHDMSSAHSDAEAAISQLANFDSVDARDMAIAKGALAISLSILALGTRLDYLYWDYKKNVR